MFTRLSAFVLLVAGLAGAPLSAQFVLKGDPIVQANCHSRIAVEFIAPMPTEEVPNFHGVSPHPESWTIVLEIAAEQEGPPLARVREGAYIPSPGVIAPLPTDVNGNGIIGDRHPAFPMLTLTMDDDLLYNGFILPAGTNLSSFFQLIGSEIEHGGGQTITVTWVLDPAFMLIDINGDMGTTLRATLHGQTDVVFVKHGFDPIPTGVHSAQNPTLSIWTSDWISTVDSMVVPGQETPFAVCVEARIPCFFDFGTNPPTPVPVDPIFGPCFGGTMMCTGTFPFFPGPGPNPMFPTLDVRFSDTYFDPNTGALVPGGAISGGACGVLWNATGGNMAFAFRQSSVHAWYGVNGVPDTGPMGGGDDQLIYRFVMLAEGQIFDTDVLPAEMMITAAIETTTNCFSITNVRVKHRPDVVTVDPQ